MTGCLCIITLPSILVILIVAMFRTAAPPASVLVGDVRFLITPRPAVKIPSSERFRV